MSVAVIERFEVVQIKIHQRTVSTIAFAGSHGLAQAIDQQTTVSNCVSASWNAS